MKKKYSSEERWLEVRKRIEPMIYAIFWQDFEIPKEEAEPHVNGILERLFRPEYLGVLEDKWSLWKFDEGERIHIRANLNYEEARVLLTQQEDPSKHWIQPSAAL